MTDIELDKYIEKLFETLTNYNIRLVYDPTSDYNANTYKYIYDITIDEFNDDLKSHEEINFVVTFKMKKSYQISYYIARQKVNQ
jgi:hypothetical protein